MLRNGGTTPTPPSNVRRRYQAWKEDQRKNGSLLNGYDYPNGFELSMHLPTRPYENRFEVLRPASPPPRSVRDTQHYPYYRRTRHGRGSKEAKRRRDARRNRRKLQAVAALDEQLSRDIERALAEANMERQAETANHSATPMLPTTTIATPQPARTPSTPPQLPHFNFGGLDLIGEYTPITPSKADSAHQSPTLFKPTIPSWCPDLPVLGSKNIRWSDFPLFFDLSKLPEPIQKTVPSPRGNDLQLWRPQPTPQPKKQSRFFPSYSSPKPTVKLPPTSCRLHADDTGLETAPPLKPKTVAESLELAVQAAEMARKAIDDKEAQKSAANLWKILTSSEDPICSGENDFYRRHMAFKPMDVMHDAPLGMFDHRLESVGMPCELDNTEVPYVHANSLTGHANERGSDRFTNVEEHTVVFEQPSTLERVQDLLGGFNELVMDPYTEEGYTDALLAVLDLPPLPPSPDLEHTSPLITDPPLESSIVIGTLNAEDELKNSDAHFKGEQALFQPPSPRPKNAEEDLVDVLTFLKMGHVDNCWCNDCGEPPELLSNNTTVEDDGWMIYSSPDGEKSPSILSAWEWE